mmetsp:Transcript_47417/g.151320  ORF Transcript_47417/g.151320 Transcript_47417/m.151320 type:complete len:256 (-) Transcript_47417:1714-2481(-)
MRNLTPSSGVVLSKMGFTVLIIWLPSASEATSWHPLAASPPAATLEPRPWMSLKVVFQAVGKRSPGALGTKSLLRKCSLRFSCTCRSSSMSSCRLETYDSLLIGGMKRPRSSRRSENFLEKIALSNFDRSEPSSRLSQKLFFSAGTSGSPELPALARARMRPMTARTVSSDMPKPRRSSSSSAWHSRASSAPSASSPSSCSSAARGLTESSSSTRSAFSAGPMGGWPPASWMRRLSSRCESLSRSVGVPSCPGSA